MILISLLLLSSLAFAQKVGKYIPNEPIPFSITVDGKVENTFLTIDANWRWLHVNDGYTNCFNADFEKQYCPNGKVCAEKCSIEGVNTKDYWEKYGVKSLSSNSVLLKYVTKHQYGTNVGSRLLLLDSTGKKYRGLDMRGKQISITYDVSKIPCGINGAVYMVQIPLDGQLSVNNSAGAPYGTGYADSQCPRDIKFAGGVVNVEKRGMCTAEMDLWEANSMATQFTPHPARHKFTYVCATEKECAEGQYRYSVGVDRDGADYNPYRLGKTTFYGPGSGFTINTLQPFTVTTQFKVDANRTLVEIVHLFTQNGKTVIGGVLNDGIVAEHKLKFKENNKFASLGGMRKMGFGFSDGGMTLLFSLWDDFSVNMKWLDSVYPPKSTAPGAKRGPCPENSGVPSETRVKFPDTQVIYSNVIVGPITNGPIAPPSSPKMCPC